jgi:MerR family redox-sensitive transcriptional activator SoxR
MSCCFSVPAVSCPDMVGRRNLKSFRREGSKKYYWIVHGCIMQVKVIFKSSSMAHPSIPIGALAKRSGVKASALRFYEALGLIKSTRSPAGRRTFARDALRRVAFIRVAQSVGLSLENIRAALSDLPNQRTPTASDWERLSGAWRPVLDQRIDVLIRLRDRLSSCIGCGCLSLKTCGLFNPNDAARVRGSGPRYLLGDVPLQPTGKVECPKRGK